MDIPAKLENQNCLSQTLLTYLSEEFLKFLRIVGHTDVCKTFHFTKDYDQLNRRVTKNVVFFVRIVKQSSPTCV